MALTSVDIQNQSFSIDRKGYDVDEVDVFLERVADEVDAFNNEIAMLQEELQRAQSAIPEQPFESQPTQVIVQSDASAAELASKDAEIAQLRRLLAEKDDEIERLKSEVDDNQVDGKAIAQALIVAQRSADEVIANANTQGDQIISDARQDANRIVQEANDEKVAIQSEIEGLFVSLDKARAEYREILKNFISDATDKLSNLDSKKPAKAKPAATSAIKTGEIYFTKPLAPAGVPSSSVAMPVSQGIEKDLSGFGDADDGFSFEELD